MLRHFQVLAPQGRHKLAQGNALGTGDRMPAPSSSTHLERAEHRCARWNRREGIRRVTPLQGWETRGIRHSRERPQGVALGYLVWPRWGSRGTAQHQNAGSGIDVSKIDPLMAVNGIALPLMSDSDVPTFRLAIVIVSVPEKVALTA
jgi:hypothetical protein